MSEPGGRDPGLQPERTLLAWRRVFLILIGLAVALPRLAWPALGEWSLGAAAAIAAVAVALLLWGGRGYRPADPALTRSSPGAILATAATAALLGLAALALVMGIPGPG